MPSREGSEDRLVLDDKSNDGNDDDDDDIDGSFRINVAKVLVECSLFDEAVEVTDALLCEDDTSAELWYVSGVALRGSGDLSLAIEHMKRCRKIIRKQFKQSSQSQEELASNGDGDEETLKERLAHVEDIVKQMQSAVEQGSKMSDS